MRMSWTWEDLSLAYREPSVRWIALRAWFTHVLLCGYVLVLLPFMLAFFVVMLASALVVLVGQGAGRVCLVCMDLVLRVGKPVHEHTRALRSRAEKTLRNKA